MLRVLCAVFVLAVAVDTVFGALSAKQRADVNKAVSAAREASGKSKLSEGDNDAFLDANGYAESCDGEFVKGEGGGAVSSSESDEFAAATGAASELAGQSGDDAKYVSCDAMTCPGTGVFVACAFKPPGK